MRLWYVPFTLSVAAAALIPKLAVAADPIKAEIVDNWGTGAERAAVKVIQDAFAARGGILSSTVVADGVQVMSSTVDRILAGDPPTSTTFTPSSLYLDLESKGQLNDIDDVATADHWRDVLPPFVIDSISYKGKVFIAPISMTITDWVYSNKALLAKAGITSLPKTYGDEFFADLDKLKASGTIPLGMGGTPTVYRWVFESIMVGVGGRDLWVDVWDHKDSAAIHGPLMRKVFETYKRLRDYSDPGYSGRSWPAAIAMVVAGKAAMSITGDWGKAEFTAAGQLPGRDFGCQLQGDPPTFVIHGDMFGFPRSSDPKVIEAQKLLARTVFDRAVQLKYNLVKSGTPARTDVDVAGDAQFDECSKAAAAAYGNGRNVLGSPQWYLSPDGVGSFTDMLSDYFSYPEMTTDQIVDQFATLLSSDHVQR